MKIHEVLTEREVKQLNRLQRKWSMAAAVGAILIVAGGWYGIWAGQRLEISVQKLPPPAFDVPISRMEQLFQTLTALPKDVRVTTDLERRLMKDREDLARFAGGMLALMSRIIIASIILMTGLLLWSIALAQRPLLRIIEKLRGRVP